VPRQFAKIEPLVERLRRVVHGVEDDRDERKRPSRVVTVAERLRQKQPAETLALESLVTVKSAIISGWRSRH